MPEPKVLTFDVVGTLIDFESGILRFLRMRCGEAAAKLSDTAILDAYRAARGRADVTPFPDDLTPLYRVIAPQLGLPDDPAIARDFAQGARGWPAFPDSVSALKRLAARYKLVAMTNAQRWALDAFQATLGHPFHDTVCVDDALCEKPDEKFFAFTRGRLSRDGFRLGDIMHVAQSQYHDIGVARRLGHTVCWIERRQGISGSGGTITAAAPTEPHYHFATLAALADLAESGALHMVAGAA
jgi:putative hydrolase of the HAD superfamily